VAAQYDPNLNKKTILKAIININYLKGHWKRVKVIRQKHPDLLTVTTGCRVDPNAQLRRQIILLKIFYLVFVKNGTD